MKAKFSVVKGDITTAFDDDHDVDFIIHGCNCHGVMGSGVAKAIADKWPRVAEADKSGINAVTGDHMPLHDRGRLGNMTAADVSGDGDIVINLYTQFDMAKGRGDVVVDWDAFERGLMENFEYMNLHKDHVGMPEIGCGLAGGEVEDFYAILDRVMTKYPYVKVTIFRL